MQRQLIFQSASLGKEISYAISKTILLISFLHAVLFSFQILMLQCWE